MTDAATRPDETLVALPLSEVDPEIHAAIGAELRRQQESLDLVAAENFAPAAVLEAQGSILQNKYADGYPGAREYDACEVVDEVERLAIERACRLFGAEHANVQAYSGSNANAAVLYALCRPGDTVLGFDFAHGGHPTHYAAETQAGRFYQGLSYTTRRDDYLIDLDEVGRLARAHRPKVIIAGWSCYSRTMDFAAFRAIADEVSAYLVCDMAHFAGLVAAGLYPDPVPYADVCTMTVHKTIGGARAGAILSKEALASRIDEAVWPGAEGGPLMHVIAGVAVSFLLASGDLFRARMARTVAGARTLAAILSDASATTKMPVRTGGTDVHQFHLDTAPSGRDARDVLAQLNRVGLSANAMRIAYDAAIAPSCSGLRLGATSLATRGFGVDGFLELGSILADLLGPDGTKNEEKIAARIRALSDVYPIYAHL